MTNKKFSDEVGVAIELFVILAGESNNSDEICDVDDLLVVVGFTDSDETGVEMVLFVFFFLDANGACFLKQFIIFAVKKNKINNF